MNQAFPALSLFGQVARGSHEIGMVSTTNEPTPPHDVGGAIPILRLSVHVAAARSTPGEFLVCISNPAALSAPGFSVTPPRQGNTTAIQLA